MIGNLLLVLMFLFFTGPIAAFGQFLLTMVYCVYGALFGLEEFLAKKFTGKTVSQHIRALVASNPKKGYKLLGFMLLGWICWLFSLCFVGIFSHILFILYWLFLTIPSILDKEYFLTLAGCTFAIVITILDAFSFHHNGSTVFTNMYLLLSSHPLKAHIALWSQLLGWLCLLAHLGLGIKHEK